MKQNNKKVLITGASGFLGVNALKSLAQKGYSVFGTDIAGLSGQTFPFIQGDLLERGFLTSLFEKVKPEIVINTVALAVDLSEEDPELAQKVNVEVARKVAQLADQYRTKLIYISTDHLFDGRETFYGEKIIPNPVNNYGRTKAAAEQACLSILPEAAIVRTNFFGWSHNGHKPTFAEWLYNSLAQKLPIKLFTNYYFTPIEVTALLEAIDLLIQADYNGIINVAGTERCSKYEFGLAMARLFNFSTESIRPVKADNQSFKVKRQPDLSLSTDKFRGIFGGILPDVKNSLIRFKTNMPVERS